MDSPPSITLLSLCLFNWLLTLFVQGHYHGLQGTKGHKLRSQLVLGPRSSQSDFDPWPRTVFQCYFNSDTCGWRITCAVPRMSITYSVIQTSSCHYLTVVHSDSVHTWWWFCRRRCDRGTTWCDSRRDSMTTCSLPACRCHTPAQHPATTNSWQWVNDYSASMSDRHSQSTTTLHDSLQLTRTRAHFLWQGAQ